MIQRYLITGGCGFLGSNIASKLIEDENTQVTIFDNLSRIGASENLAWLRKKGKVVPIHGDIRNIEEIENVINLHKPDVVYHLAGQVAMTTSIERPIFDFSTNAIGSINLLEAVRKYAPKARILYSSTNKVYGDLSDIDHIETPTRYQLPDFPDGLPETLPLSFHSPYGCSKGSADQYFLDYARIYGIETIVFRHSSMYGGRQFSTIDQGWIGWFIASALKQRMGEKIPFTISGTGKQVRDVLYASDMINLYIKASTTKYQKNENVFNIGGGPSNSLSIIELLKLLQEELDIELKYDNIAERQSDQKVFIANIEKAEKNFDWHVKVNISDGLRKMITWVKSNIC